MSWVQIKFDTTRDQAPALAQSLDVLGAQAVTFRDGAHQAIFEPAPGDTPLWQVTEVVALFDGETDAETVVRRLDKLMAPLPLPSHCVQRLADRAWERVCMDQFRATRFGTRLWVSPSWSPEPPPPAVNVSLDPGLAFGTGTHPTTALCLEWLDGASLKGVELIDYGCGSGILAIAGLLLGARRAWAVDTDPQALIAARDNAAHNSLADRIRIASPSQLPAVRAEVLMANILAGPLENLAGTLAGHVKDGGLIVLSGILREQVAGIHEAYRPYFAIESSVYRDEWARITARRVGSLDGGVRLR